MGVVVAARHIQLEQIVAIKLLAPEAMEDEVAIERFLREARAAAKLRSDHVARVLDVGRLDDRAPYMVMEYLDGADLGEVLDLEGPFSPEIACEYIVQACDAVAEAHARGIVHRDLEARESLSDHPRGRCVDGEGPRLRALQGPDREARCAHPDAGGDGITALHGAGAAAFVAEREPAFGRVGAGRRPLRASHPVLAFRGGVAPRAVPEGHARASTRAARGSGGRPGGARRGRRTVPGERA